MKFFIPNGFRYKVKGKDACFGLEAACIFGPYPDDPAVAEAMERYVKEHNVPPDMKFLVFDGTLATVVAGEVDDFDQVAHEEHEKGVS